MADPPVDMVGLRPVQISSKSLIHAASSMMRRARASDLPASGDVGMAVIEDPLSNRALCFVFSNLARSIHVGRLSSMTWTFLMKFMAVFIFVAMTRMFLSFLNSANQSA